MRKGINLAIAVWLILPLLAIPAAEQDRAQKKAKSEVGRKAPAQPGQTPKSPAANPDYVIAPDDVIDVDVWKEPEITKTVPVRPDGKISLPLLEDVQAAGLTATALASVITERLKKYVSNPQVTVIVTTVSSQHIYIMGEVNKGGVYPLLPNMSVLQALSTAGGFTQFANLKNIYVLRNENGKQVKYPFNYKEAIKGKRPSQDINLMPGDTIVVP